jgi:hypothetical protein
VSSEIVPRIGANPDPPRRSPWSARLRLVTEFVLLFALALLLKHVLWAVVSGPYPNPFWLPVLVLSLQHGMAAGLTAAVLAAALQLLDGPPPALLPEDLYSYVGRIAAEPIGWTCVALLIGHTRSRQLDHLKELEADLAEQSQQAAVVADLCEDLRARTETLERHIAANADASNVDVAEAITELHDATWDNFADRLARFVSLMTGTAEFSILMLRDGALKPVFHPADDHRQAADAVVAAEDPLFAAIVNEKRILSATRIADRTLLGNRGVLAGPLVDPQASDRVLGMFAIAGAALDDHPEDIERRFALTVSEVSRLVGRIVLMENWQAAAAPGQANGHAEKPHDAASNGQGGVQQGDAPQDGAPQAGTPRAASGRRPRRDREVTLQ